MDFHQFIESFKLTFLGICKIKVKFTNSFTYKIDKNWNVINLFALGPIFSRLWRELGRNKKIWWKMDISTNSGATISFYLKFEFKIREAFAEKRMVLVAHYSDMRREIHATCKHSTFFRHP